MLKGMKLILKNNNKCFTISPDIHKFIIIVWQFVRILNDNRSLVSTLLKYKKLPKFLKTFFLTNTVHVWRVLICEV